MGIFKPSDVKHIFLSDYDDKKWFFPAKGEAYFFHGVNAPDCAVEFVDEYTTDAPCKRCAFNKTGCANVRCVIDGRCVAARALVADGGVFKYPNDETICE